MMNFARLRNGKVRVLLGMAVGFILLVVTFVVHDTHTKLVATRIQAQDCEHKQESLSAQLQVVHEHRTRLEKALQQEKLAHKQTKEKLESQYEELQEQTDKEKQEALSKHATLQQQYKALQSQQDDLHEEFSKLQQTNAELQEEKQNLVNKMTSQQDQLRISKDEEIGQLQASISKLQKEKEAILIKMDQSSKIGQLEDELEHCKQQQLMMLQTSDQSKVQPTVTLAKIKDVIKPSDFVVEEAGAPLANSLTQQQLFDAPKTFVTEKQLRSGPLGAGAFEAAPIDEIKQSALHLNRHAQRENLNLPGVLPAPNFYPVKNPPAMAPLPVAQEDKNDGHQLANPHDVDGQLNEEVQRQVEQPQKVDVKKLVMPEPRLGRDHKDVNDAPHRGAIFGQEGEPEGLEQQEHGDQDLDDMDNEVLGGERKDNGPFVDNDFDQADQDDNDGNRNKNPLQIKPEGVIAAPH